MRVVKRCVKTAFLKQLVVVALFDDVAVFDDENDVRVADGRKPMCDDKTGSADHEFGHGFLNFDFRAGIDVGSGLVENEHPRVRQHGPRNRDQLFLSLGDIYAVVGEQGVVSVR